MQEKGEAAAVEAQKEEFSDKERRRRKEREKNRGALRKEMAENAACTV